MIVKLVYQFYMAAIVIIVSRDGLTVEACLKSMPILSEAIY